MIPRETIKKGKEKVMNVNTSKKINYNQLDPKRLDEVFEKNNFCFTRQLRISVLKKVLEEKYTNEKKELEKMKVESANSLTIKESIRLYRLNHLKSLSEFQLENDFVHYNDKVLVDSYLKAFWDELSKYIQTLGHADTIFEEIEKLGKQEVSVRNVCDYNNNFAKRVIDESDCFDGIRLVDAVKHFNDTSGANEITDLSKKYGLSIPKYWRKNDLQLRLKSALEAKNELSAEMIEKIDASSIKKLTVLLDENNVDSKLHLTKADMIDIIIRTVDKDKVTSCARTVKPELEKVVKEVIIQKERRVQEERRKNRRNAAPNVIVTPVVVDKAKDYEELLKTIISNQEIMIEQNKESLNKTVEFKSHGLSKTFNIVILILIISVVVFWILWGDTLF